MPHINSRGDIAHGVGGGYLNINNQRIRPGGVMGWFDDDTVAFADGDGDSAWLASLYHVPTQTVTLIDEHIGGPVGGRGSNSGYAKNNRVIWWHGSRDPNTVGIWSNFGFRSQLGGLCGLGPDGAVVYRPDYQSNGPTLYREPDGSEWPLTNGSPDVYATATSVCPLGESRLVYEEGLRPFTVNLPPVLPFDGPTWGSRGAFLGGQWWFACFHDLHGVTLRPFNSFEGFSITGKGVEVWFDMRAMTDDIVRFAMSRRIGEQAGEIYCREYDVVRGLVRDPWGANTWQTIAREDTSQIGVVPPAVGNASITLDKTSGPSPLTVVATLTQENLTTWRWLLDDAIHQPIDGNTHTFVIETEGTHVIGLRGGAPAGTVLALPQTVTVTAPAAVGEASITVDKTQGPVPFTFTATLTQKNLTTWRWLLNGSIDQPIDGLTHSFTVTTPGDYSISVRGSAPAGVVMSNFIRVTARPKLDFIPGKKCVQAGFSEPIGNDASGTSVIRHLKSIGWDMARIEGTDDATKNQSLADEVMQQGMRPLITVQKFEQVALVPEWTDVELLNEPNLKGWTPQAYADAVKSVIPVALQRNQRLWVGCINNTGKGDLEWLRQVLALLPADTNASLHRYPQTGGDTPDKPRSDYATRAEEMAAVKAVVGTRKWGVSEFAYSMEPYSKPLTLWEKIKKFFGWKPPTSQFTESEQASYAKQEFNLWFAAGADFVTWYQVWEDDTPDVGLMRIDRTWKLVSEIFK